MKKLYYLIFTFTLFISILIPQELITNVDSPAVIIIKNNASAMPDSLAHDKELLILEENDGLFSANDSAEELSPNSILRNKNDISFFDKYQGLFGALIGALFGAAGAGLIALYSIKKTHQNSTELVERQLSFQTDVRQSDENFKRINLEKLYCGLLYMIHRDLNSHEEYSKLLIKSINGYQEYILSKQALPAADPFYKYQFDLLQEVVIDILKFDMYDTTIVGSMSPYLQKIKKINHDLDLTEVREMAKVDRRSDFFDGIKEYLDIVIEDISDINTASKDIRKLIKDEIGKFSHSDIVLPNELKQKTAQK